MSRFKRCGLKKLTLILGLILIMALDIIGISYGAWTDLLNINYDLATAEFEPLIEVYKVARVWEFETELGDIDCREEEFDLSSNPLTPDGSGVITVNIPGHGINRLALRNDRYKIYYRLINHSTIPIDYMVFKQNLTSTQESCVEVWPEVWTGIEPNDENSQGYASIHIKYRPLKGINPFNLPALNLARINKTFAGVAVKQFNATTGDYGWTKNVQFRIYTNRL